MRHTIKIDLEFDIDIWDGLHESVSQELIDRMLEEVEAERHTLIMEAKAFLLSELLDK